MKYGFKRHDKLFHRNSLKSELKLDELMAYNQIRKHPKHSENPFVEKAIQDIQISRKTQVVRPSDRSAIQQIVNKDGEPTGHTAFLRFIEVDEEQFAKVYLSQFAAFWELTKPAIRVFGYVIQILKPDSDRFIFKMKEAKDYTKYSQDSSVFSGLSKLIECGIIARSEYDFEYFINPLVVFNGRRVTFAKTYVKKQRANPNQVSLFDSNEAVLNFEKGVTKNIEDTA